MEFNYNGGITNFDCNENEKMSEICKKFLTKNLYFSYEGKYVNLFDEQLNFKEFSNSKDKERKKITILVFNKSKDIICPECGENAKIKINNYNISLYDCKNGHTRNNILFDEFEKKQLFDVSKKVYNYGCEKHNKTYIKYCNKCKINICPLCEKDHLIHDTINLGDMTPNEKELKEKLLELEKKINLLNENITEKSDISNKIKENINKYYQITHDIINNYNPKNINYEILFNLKEILDNNDILKDINEINCERNKQNRINYINDIYKNLNNKEIKNNEIKLTLKVEKDDINKDIYFLDNTKDTIYLSGKWEEHNHDFLKELNDSNTEIYINNLKYKYDKKFQPDKEGTYFISIKFKSKVTDCCCMFFGCENITHIDLSSFDSSNVINMECMFFSCNKVKNIDLSNLDTKNVTNMECMFCNFKSITNIDLSNFDTKNVTNMDSMFSNCINLIHLDISNFDTSNVINIQSMFYNCYNLIDINLSSFDTKNVTLMQGMFANCKSLLEIDLSNFDTKKVISMNWMFFNCYNLINLNLSSFNTENVIYMNSIFYNCYSLTNIFISSLDIKNVLNPEKLFSGCNSLKQIKIINANNANNVNNGNNN